MFKCKVKLSTRGDLDTKYKRFIEILMKVSDLQEIEILDRKNNWEEYEVWENREYVIECELSEDEYKSLSDSYFVVEKY